MKRFVHDNYYWVVAVVALFCYTIYGGILNNTASLYLIPVSEGLGVSRTAVSLTNSLRSVGAFFSNLIFGFVYKKFGFRKLATVGLIVVGLAFFGYASAQTVFAYGLCSVMLGLFDSFCSTSSLSKLVNDWFHEHRGLVFGVITASSGFGGSLFSILLTNVMKKSGWRASHILSAVLMVIAAFCVLVLIRSKPSDIGLKPFGEGKGDAHKKAKHHPEHLGLPASRLLRTPTFYLMMFNCALSAACAYGPLHILVSHLRDCGFSATDAAKVQSILYLLMAGTKILDGYLSDLVGARIVVIVSLLSCGACCWLYAGVVGMSTVVLPTILFAIGLPLTSILQPLSISAVFGQRSYDTTVGLTMAMVCVAGMSGAPIMNAFYGLLGSYSTPLKGVAVLSVFSTLLYLLICKMADRDIKKFESEGNMPI